PGSVGRTADRLRQSLQCALRHHALPQGPRSEMPAERVRGEERLAEIRREDAAPPAGGTRETLCPGVEGERGRQLRCAGPAYLAPRPAGPGGVEWLPGGERIPERIRAEETLQRRPGRCQQRPRQRPAWRVRPPHYHPADPP